MNLRTTLVLIVLAVAGGIVWQVGPKLPPDLDPNPLAVPVADQGTLDVFEKDIKPEKIKRIVVQHGKETLLEFNRAGQDWTMPGSWPTRTAEVNVLVERLCSMRSRFAPLSIGSDSDLKEYNLDDPQYVVTIEMADAKFRIELAEGSVKDNTFFRPLYARLGKKNEVIRLAPGLLGVLGRAREFYQKRQLFPSIREARGPESPDRVDRLEAERVVVENKTKDGQSYTLAKTSRGWGLAAPSIDRLDPEKANQVREAIADLWAERFVEGSSADVCAILGNAALSDAGLAGPWTSLSWLAPLRQGDTAGNNVSWRKWIMVRAGLEKPERILRVTQAGGTIALQIGTISSSRARPTPPPRPGMPPEPPTFDEYRYAKLENNDQIFEVKADKLKDLFVLVAGLREIRLARFEAKNVRRVEVTQGTTKTAILFRDEKDEKLWRVEVPGEGGMTTNMEAKEDKVNDLLSALSGLNAQDKDTDLPGFVGGLAGLGATPFLNTPVALYPGSLRSQTAADVFRSPLAVVKLTVNEGKEEEKKEPREIILVIGEPDPVNKLLRIKVDDWPRIELADEAVLPLIKRPALAYRGKLFDFALGDVQQLLLEQDGKKIVLAQGQNNWQMTMPATADADAGKVGQLLTALTKLEPIEYVAEDASAADLETKYGLMKPALAVTIRTKNQEKTLRIGKKQDDKPQFYARLDGSPSVFAVPADLQFSLKADSLSYLPPQLWRIESAKVQTIRVEKEGAEPFELEKQDGRWKLAKPLSTPASEETVQSLLDILASPFSDRYEAHEWKDEAKYGFDKPFMKVKLGLSQGSGAARELVLGKTTGKDSTDRYAHTTDNTAVSVMRGDVIKSLDHGSLDLIDTQLLNVPLDSVLSVESTSSANYTLKPAAGAWKVTDGPGSPYSADENAIAALRAVLFNLRADRFVAYGTKLDLPKYGLDKPSTAVTFTLPDGPGKTRQRVLAIGGEVEGSPGRRYARLDQSPGVAVLGRGDTQVLTRTPLDYVNHRMLKLAPDKVTGLQRVQGEETLQLAKQADEWEMLKPQAQRAEDRTVEGLLKMLADLRASQVVEYPLKDSQKKYGFDAPSLTLTLKMNGADGKQVEHVLTLGGEVKEKPGDRYAKIDATLAVFVLPAVIVKALETPPLTFRTRLLVRFSDADKILLERGPRQATFARDAGSWAMTAPAKAKVDNDQMEEFLSKAAKLEADELIADKPADLKVYGLDKPIARWRFQTDGKDALDLLIGKLDAGGKRAYAKLGNGTLVFLLGPDLTKTALGEFRERTVWGMPLDSAQADTLKLTRDGKTIVLKKRGTVWTVEGKPETPLSNDTVNDTIAALAGLKLERYAVDKDADRKLFGLDPPELVIEAEAGEKKVVLHIGRFEGGSKRAYAALPDKDRSEVLVLSESDTARLTRDLAALAKPLPKKPLPEGHGLPGR